jgi:hypothetical protein
LLKRGETQKIPKMRSQRSSLRFNKLLYKECNPLMRTLHQTLKLKRRNKPRESLPPMRIQMRVQKEERRRKLLKRRGVTLMKAKMQMLTLLN